MIKLRNLFLASAFLIIAFSSCRDCVEGTGVLLSEERTSQIPDFSEIEANGSFDVYLTMDTITEVIVEGDDNIVPYIKTYVRGDRLIIENRSSKCFEYDLDMQVHVRVPFVDKVVLNGSGNLSCNNWSFDHDDLYLNNSGSGNMYFKYTAANFIEAKLYGSGNIELSGIGDNADYILSGSGSIKARGYAVDVCYANNSGSGNITVKFYDELKVDLSGSGSVYFNGNSFKVFINDDGSGSVRED